MNTRTVLGSVLGALALVSTATVNASTVLSAQGGSAGGSTHVPLVAFGKAASDAEVAEIQVTDGNTLTKTLLGIATGKVDMGIIPVAATGLLRGGKGPYKKLDEGTRGALKSKLRAVFGFDAGYYTFVTFSDSGIENFDDFKGKKVLVGPPSGAASNNSIAMIEAAAGLKAGDDYEAVKMGWGAVNQAFTDRKVDVLMRPGPWPSAPLMQLQAAGEVRVLGLPASVISGPVSKRTGFGGYEVAVSDMGEGNFVFSGEGTGDGNVNLIAYKMMLTVNESMDEELVYGMTKAFFDRYDDAMKSAAWMPGLNIKRVITGLEEVEMKLHPGAIRYYQEAGFSLPDSVM
ncbi:MAG: TAXI family TRAP transporter solute-binding subunit [Pseudomonadota bacterium]